jgi:hypothetical protein
LCGIRVKNFRPGGSAFIAWRFKDNKTHLGHLIFLLPANPAPFLPHHGLKNVTAVPTLPHWVGQGIGRGVKAAVGGFFLLSR